MNKSGKLFVAIATMILTVAAIEPLMARGGAASIMNSPGYQRRLQESRQQLSQPDAQLPTRHRGRNWKHRRK